VLNGYRSAGYNVGKVKRQMWLLVEGFIKAPSKNHCHSETATPV